MPAIKITYFPVKGRAEASRLALAIGGIHFEDERIPRDEFGKRKAAGDLMFGSLPVMTVDGTQYAQSDAMLHYCGKLAGLIPDDPLDGLKVDIVIGALEDVIQAVFADSSKEAREKFATEGVARYFGPIEKLYSESSGPFLLGDTLSIADLKLYTSDDMLKSGMVDHVPKGVLDKYENIGKCVKAVGEHEKVAAWNAKHYFCHI